MKFCVDFKQFIVEFEKLVKQGKTFWVALAILAERYGKKED